MPVYVVYLKDEEKPRILKAERVDRVDHSFNFTFEDGDSLVFSKDQILFWDAYEEGETAVIRNQESIRMQQRKDSEIEDAS